MQSPYLLLCECSDVAVCVYGCQEFKLHGASTLFIIIILSAAAIIDSVINQMQDE